MLVKITEKLWLDLERLIRVAAYEEEVVYTQIQNEKAQTYCVDIETGYALLAKLNEHDMLNKISSGA